MESEEPGGAAALQWTDSGWPDAREIPAADSAAAVATLYQNHAVGLIRLAYLMLGDRAGAEDAVQDAFCGLYRHWDRLTDQDRALAYVRTAVLNACRSALRRRASGRRLTAYQPPTASAEAAVLGREERQEVMRAVRQLPGRQREALVLRYYHIGPVLSGTRLVVFDLATGTERAWSFKTCAQCNPSSGGLGYGGTNVDALSWTGDGKHIAFVGPNRAGWPSHSTVRLLDVTLPGSDLLANSRPVATLPPGDNATDLSWRGAIITPDGQTVVMVEELATDRAPIMVRDRLLKVSVTTGRVTVLNDRNVLAGYQYEQVMYTNATGSVLVVSGARKGMTAGVVRGNRYTPVRWSRKIVTAAW